MADFYVDHGAYASALGTTPTWGVPQEGDGSTKDAATAAAVAEIQIVASPSASETIVIAGATITAGASAAANVFVHGATPADTATNIVTLLNSANATNTVSASVAVASGNNSNQLRNMVFARVKPGATDTVQIMFRIGSTALNHVNNPNVAISSSGWASAPVVTQFVGGGSGCWGRLMNPAAIGVSSSIAIGVYGVFAYAPQVCKSGTSSVYQLAIEDVVHCRNNNKTIDISGITSHGRFSGNLNLLVDNNTVWTGDPEAGTLTLRFNLTVNNNYPTLRLSSSVASKQTIIQARRHKGLLIAMGGTITAGSLGLFFSGPDGNVPVHTRIRNVEFRDDHSNATFVSLLRATTNWADNHKFGMVTFESCLFNHSTARSTQSGTHLIGFGASLAGEAVTSFTDCEFYYNWNGLSAPAFGFIQQFIAQGRNTLYLKNCRITGVAFPYPIVLNTAWSNKPRVFIDNLAGGAIPSAIAGLQAAYGNSTSDPDAVVMRVTQSEGNREFRYENLRGVADWVASLNNPTLYATLPNGTPWSMRLLWQSDPAKFPPMAAFEAPPLVKQYRVAAATADVILRLWCKAALSLSWLNFKATLTFTDTSGAVQTVHKFGSDVVSDNAPWGSTASYPSPTYEARKVTFNTGAYQIKQHTEVVVQVTLFGPSPTGTVESLFLDPEVVIQ